MGMMFPAREKEPDLIAFPLTLPMGWKESPPWFSTTTETVADLANDSINCNANQPAHRLDATSETPVAHGTTSPSDSKATTKANKDVTTRSAANKIITTNAGIAKAPRPQLSDQKKPDGLQATSDKLRATTKILRPSQHPTTPSIHRADAAKKPLRSSYWDVYVDDFIGLVQGNRWSRRKEPASAKKLLKGDGTWATQKVVLGWLINTLDKTLLLPPHRIQRLHEILSSIQPDQRRVATKTWHKVLGELRSMAIAIPGARGLFCTLQEAFRHPDGHKGRLKLHKHVHDFLLDFRWLANNLSARPTKIAELVPNRHPSTLGASDAAGHGMGGIHFIPLKVNGKVKLVPHLWRARFPDQVTKRLVSDSNPKGDITNSDLELAGSIAHVDVLANTVDVREETLHNFYDNIPTVYWQRRTLALMPTPQAITFRSDFGLVQEAIRSGITSKRASALDHHWGRWHQFCFEHGIDPFLRKFQDPIPILQVFGQQYRDGRRAPSGNTAGSRTVEDAIRAVGQKFTSMGAKDPRRDFHGNIDFRIQRQLRAWRKQDSPPARVKPIPITVIMFILNLAFNHSNCPFRQALADLITIAFFFLLRPGEYTGTTTDDAAFVINDVLLHLDQEKLDIYTSPLWKIENATSARYIFTTQKNGRRGDIIAHTCSGHDLCCPVRATIRRILHHRAHNSPRTTVFASCYRNNRRHILKAKDVTDELKSAVDITSSETGLHPKDVSARSLRAGGAMALLCGNVDSDLIKLLGRWHSDVMMRYLHQEAQPILKKLASAMFNKGTYTFLPDETVPVNPQE